MPPCKVARGTSVDYTHEGARPKVSTKGSPEQKFQGRLGLLRTQALQRIVEIDEMSSSEESLSSSGSLLGVPKIPHSSVGVHGTTPSLSLPLRGRGVTDDMAAAGVRHRRIAGASLLGSDSSEDGPASAPMDHFVCPECDRAFSSKANLG